MALKKVLEIEGESTVTQARIGSDGTNYLNGHLATINYYDQFSSQIYTRRKNKVVFNVI